ncbi:MAG: mechanosensitive ion channel [Euryarchaeota archaeon]|nr:mechanosensitive ion channel [Euryarchaeota archaeon]
MFHEHAWGWFLSLPLLAQRIFGALLILAIGWFAIRILKGWADAALVRAPHIDDTLRSFFRTLIGAGLWVLLVVVVLGVAGVNVAALVGGLAIGGFIVGFAIKDTLNNLAAGVMLLLYRPYSVGEVVEIAGSGGGVTGLGLAMTRLKTYDGKIITIPNGAILGGAIINHTREPIRMAEVKVGISYNDDIDTAVKAILGALAKEPRVLKEPIPEIRITTLGDSSVGLQVRPWVATVDIWRAQADLHKTVKLAVEAAGCTIPFPQRDVHLTHEAKDE